VIAEDIGIIAFSGGDALFFFQLAHRRNQVAVLGRQFVLLLVGGPRHACSQGARQLAVPAFQKGLYVAHRFGVDLRCGQILHARP
jgi:hypothetical protein